MKKVATKIIDTPLGLMRLRAKVDGLTEVEFLDKAGPKAGLKTPKSQERGQEGLAKPGLDEALTCCTKEAHDGAGLDDEVAGSKEEAQISALLHQAEIQLREYFEGRRKLFDLPQAPSGTDFQLKVWAELRKIPYGETRTYGDIASALGKPKAARAVGGANNKNPLSILIPCHRVIGRDGSLVGYASGLDIKEKLLKMEGEGL